MRVLAAAVLLGALAAGCGSPTAAEEPTSTGPPPETDLVIRVWQQGDLRKQPLRWTLTCEPIGGTHPSPAAACRKLLALEDPFAEVAPDVACTQLYGGPQVAEVSGKLRGEAVLTRFGRADGCQIDRWDTVGFLFAGAAMNS